MSRGLCPCPCQWVANVRMPRANTNAVALLRSFAMSQGKLGSNRRIRNEVAVESKSRQQNYRRCRSTEKSLLLNIARVKWLYQV